MEGISVEQAMEQILQYTPVINETEEVELNKAGGRILAQDMVAEFNNPPFDRSPVDGYACKAEDLAGASSEHPVKLKVMEEIDAGQYSERVVESGQAVRIMTGAAIPKGCDCCIFQEDTDYGEETVEIYREVKQWDNYCFAGEDFKKGTTLLKKGTHIGYVEAAVLAGMGAAKVPVYRRPKVVLLTTGDEVVEPGNPLPAGKIYNSNMTMLSARMMELGIEPFYMEAVKDNPQVMAEKIKEIAEQADMIITTGGVSVGKKDIMHESIRLIDAERIFWRVNMKPGMPTLFSVYKNASGGKVPVISLSGNPFGVAVTIELLIRPALEKMMQNPAIGLKEVTGVMADDFVKGIKGRRLIRAYWENGRFHLPNGLHSNGVLSSMAGCNCLIDTKTMEDKESKSLKTGDKVSAVWL
ncbi:molybdopterin molybdenumtransferase MoeA [Ruminococcus sp. AF41-9]|nr:molybdopterin molybdenumtransferase MoeA [Ruminococcus sp. AF41-9]